MGFTIHGLYMDVMRLYRARLKQQSRNFATTTTQQQAAHDDGDEADPVDVADADGAVAHALPEPSSGDTPIDAATAKAGSHIDKASGISERSHPSSQGCSTILRNALSSSRRLLKIEEAIGSDISGV